MLHLHLARGGSASAWMGAAGDSVGVLPVAPQHLHDALALRVGAAPRRPLIERVARCTAALTATPGVWSESMAHAPLRTAKAVLNEVESLALAGARLECLPPSLSARLKVAWACERLDGWFDAVTRAASTARLHGRITCHTARATLPARVQALLASLEANRWEVMMAPTPQAMPPVLQVTAPSPASLAEQVALRLAKTAPTSTVVIAPSATFATAWSRQGLPALGDLESDRLAHSWLHTLLGIARVPDDVGCVRALVEHPWCHVPPGLRRALLEALATWPSHRATPWREAVSRAQAHPGSPEATAAQRIEALVQGGVKTPDDLFARWRALIEALPESNGARLLSDALTVFATCVPAVLTDPRLDDGVALAAESFRPIPRRHAETGGATVAHPGAVLAPVDHLVVWGESALAPPPDGLDAWSAPAREALRQRGVLLPSRAQQREMFLHDLLRAFSHTQTRVWLCDAALDEAGQLPRQGVLVPWIDARLRAQHHPGVTRDEGTPYATRSPQPAPGARRRWAHRRTLPRRTESPSSVATLLGCSLRHTLRYHAGLREDTHASLPQGALLAGRITHEVIAQSLLPRVAPGVVAERAAEAVDAFIEAHAPSLCLPAMRPMRHRLRVSTARTGALLAEMFADAPGEVFTEHALHPPSAWGPVRLRGRADLIALQPATVLDLKWSAASHRRALTEGTALQLALYAWALREAQGGAWPAVGYVIVEEATAFVSGVDSSSSGGAASPNVREVRGVPVSKTLDAARRTLQQVVELRAQGTSVAEGIAAADGPLRGRDELVGDELRVAPGCRYCAFDALCGRAWTEVNP